MITAICLMILIRFGYAPSGKQIDKNLSNGVDPLEN